MRKQTMTAIRSNGTAARLCLGTGSRVFCGQNTAKTPNVVKLTRAIVIGVTVLLAVCFHQSFFELTMFARLH